MPFNLAPGPSMSLRAISLLIVASLASAAIGFAVGTTHGTDRATRELRGDAVIGTAGHLSTLVSIAGFLRDGRGAQALELAESMIGADIVLVGPSSHDIDEETRGHVRKALSGVSGYCARYPERAKYTPCGG